MEITALVAVALLLFFLSLLKENRQHHLFRNIMKHVSKGFYSHRIELLRNSLLSYHTPSMPTDLSSHIILEIKLSSTVYIHSVCKSLIFSPFVFCFILDGVPQRYILVFQYVVHLIIMAALCVFVCLTLTVRCSMWKCPPWELDPDRFTQANSYVNLSGSNSHRGHFFKHPRQFKTVPLCGH